MSLQYELENDPFQIFEVEIEACFDLKVEVKRGDKITKGSKYKDFYDIPDPYVVLKVPGSPNSLKRTSCIKNSINPLWDQTFHFFLDPKEENILHITLMDANAIMNDEILGTNFLNMNALTLNVPSEFIFTFPAGSEVYTTITLQKNEVHDLRFSMTLCEEEKKFLQMRKWKIFQKMQELLGPQGPSSTEEVPIVAVLGSGGGFRALICYSAVLKVLHESAILDCSTYIAGLSESSWLMSAAYTQDNFPEISYDDLCERLRNAVTENWNWNLMNIPRYAIDIMSKKQGGQSVSTTDILGHLLGDILLKDKKSKRLSDLEEIVSQGLVPLPIFTCLQVKESFSHKEFSEWMEFTPYEVGIAKYGTFMQTKYFGSRFLAGRLIKQYPEFPLHYLQGIWGSNFSVLMGKLVSEEDVNQFADTKHTTIEEREINEKIEEISLRIEKEKPTLNTEDTDTESEEENENGDEAKTKRKPNWDKEKKLSKSSILQNLMQKINVGRAVQVINPLRGLSLHQSFPLCPFSATANETHENETDTTQMCLNNTTRKLSVVDSSLCMNSPYPPLLRPQRGVDIYLSFDFSQRSSDNQMPFNELLLAEKWAQRNRVPFPPIEKQVKEISKDEDVQELYIFRDPDNPSCPTVLHFPIVNNKYKKEKKPGVPRDTQENLDFADFSLFDDPSQPFGSTKLTYEPLQYERLFRMTEFNTLLGLHAVKFEMGAFIARKRNNPTKNLMKFFSQMEQVPNFCNDMRRSNDMSLQVNESKRQLLIEKWKNKYNFLGCDHKDVEFFDACEELQVDLPKKKNN